MIKVKIEAYMIQIIGIITQIEIAKNYLHPQLNCFERILMEPYKSEYLM